MTENELIELRDSLLGFDTQLTDLENRIAALESSALPKNAYFESIKAAFESSPECCTSAVVECGCHGAIDSIYLENDGDSVTYANAIFTINGETVDDADLSAFIEFEPTDPIYVFYAPTEGYVASIHILRIVNVTSEDLCIEITVNYPSSPLKQVQIPDEEFGDGHVYKTSFNFWGDDANYVMLNNSFQVISNTAELGKIKFCLNVDNY